MERISSRTRARHIVSSSRGVTMCSPRSPECSRSCRSSGPYSAKRKSRPRESGCCTRSGKTKLSSEDIATRVGRSAQSRRRASRERSSPCPAPWCACACPAAEKMKWRSAAATAAFALQRTPQRCPSRPKRRRRLPRGSCIGGSGSVSYPSSPSPPSSASLPSSSPPSPSLPSSPPPPPPSSAGAGSAASASVPVASCARCTALARS